MSKYKSGNEFLPYHAQASHTPPDYRDGWNACYKLAADKIQALQLENESLKQVARFETDVAAQAIADFNALQLEVDALRKDAEWQPIETAPKDGTEIVVGYGRQSGFPKEIVFFNNLHKFWSHYGEARLGLEANATHYMLLPKPPAIKGEQA